MIRVAVVGAGAAGCFCSIEIKRRRPDAEVVVYEAGDRPLAKVLASGGGRCNFTNTFDDISSVEEVYPRGASLMKRLLKEFGPEDIRKWFETEGVPSVAEDDGRVFPKSQKSSDIAGALLREMKKCGVILVCGRHVRDLEEIEADAVVLTTGGRLSSLKEDLCTKEYLLRGIPTTKALPSLFSFKINDRTLRALAGISVRKVSLGLAGTRFKSSGDILITDWGVSGPAVLKLSSYAAVLLGENNYRADLVINWCGCPEDEIRQTLSRLAAEHPKKRISGIGPEGIPSRLWKYLLSKAGVKETLLWENLNTKNLNRTVSLLVSDNYRINGRNRFKAEFVTCGGVAAEAVNPSTLECRSRKGLFFAGEILDIDAVTGGFNLQAAWSTAMAVAKAVSRVGK